MSDDESQHVPPELTDDETNKTDESMFSSAISPPTVDVSLDAVDDNDDDEENPFGETTSTPIISSAQIREKTPTNTTNVIEAMPSSFDDDNDPFGVETSQITTPIKIERPAPSPPTPIQTEFSSPLTTTESIEIKPSAPIQRSNERKIEITISDPTKVGEGMSSYMSYRITTKTSLLKFKSSEFSVNRRFSDFLGLHHKLINKYLHSGYLLPLPPEKDSISMVKVKISKDEGPTNFIDRRRALLERYLNRLIRNDKILDDSDVREFIEFQHDLPKATNTQALSGAGMISGLNKLSNQMTKLTTKTSEQDQWFEEKYAFVIELETNLKYLYNQMNSLFNHRREAGQSLKQFSNVLNHLAHFEEHALLSSALVDLADVEEKLEQLTNEIAMKEYATLSELVKEYIGLLEMVQMSFDERIKTHQKWLNAEDTLKKKRETKSKLEQSAKNLDKLPQAEKEIHEWEGRVVAGKEDFERISTTIKHEFEVFEETRVDDFKQAIDQYLKSLLDEQERILQIWENYLPEANKILI